MTHSLPTVDTAINSIDSISGYDASTGASTLSNNTWGFRKNTGTVQEPVYTNWYAVGAKDSTGTVIDSPGEGTGSYCDSLSYPLNQSGCNPSSYRTYNINVGAKLTSSLPAGTYTNDIVFSATTKSEGTKYTMNFNSNGGNNGNIINPRIVIAGLSTILPTSGFTKDGMGIKGWAFKSGVTPSTANTSADTTMYNAGQSVAINDLLTAALNAGQNPSTNNSFTVYAVWETAYTINFNKNSNEAIGSMNPDTPIVQSATYTIPAATFTREGYNFIGWALSSSAATAGTVAYTAGQTTTVSSLITAAQAAGQTVTPGTAGTITLYAVWEEATVYMQNFDCDTRLPNIGDSTTAVDRRDNTTYTVKRLADDKCWMTDNLILGHDKGYALTSELTNIPNNDDGTLSNNGTYYLPQAGYSGALNSPSTTGSAVFDTSTRLDQAQVQYRAQGSSGDQQSSGTLGQSTGYYNFYAATLGCSYYQDGLSQCVSGYIQKDICPKGWHLPTGGASGQFKALDIALNPDDASAGTNRTNTTSRDRFLNQASFLYSGYYLGSQLYGVGSYGRWRSSTVFNASSGYYLYLGSDGYIDPQSFNGKNLGLAVRCLSD